MIILPIDLSGKKISFSILQAGLNYGDYIERRPTLVNAFMVYNLHDHTMYNANPLYNTKN
ncbi:hypothetical protein DSUL_50286 [Desulfovibrionales bacterium]